MHNKTFDLLFYLIHHSDLNVWLRSAKLQVGVPDITYVFDISSRGHNYTSANFYVLITTAPEAVSGVETAKM